MLCSQHPVTLEEFPLTCYQQLDCTACTTCISRKGISSKETTTSTTEEYTEKALGFHLPRPSVLQESSKETVLSHGK